MGREEAGEEKDLDGTGSMPEAVKDQLALPESEIFCAICMQEIEARVGRVVLPCSCQVDYHPRCWRSALESGLRSNSHKCAKCPTCRRGISVRFIQQESALQ